MTFDDTPATCGPLRFLRGSHAVNVPQPSMRSVPLPQRLRAWKRWAAHGGPHDESIVAATGLTIVEAIDVHLGDITLHRYMNFTGQQALNYSQLKSSIFREIYLL
jgi:hypothetical protein